MVKRIIIFLFLITHSVIADECSYQTETITENGVIVSTKEIKVCNETVKMSNGFWNDLMYSEQGNELFWNAMIFVFSMTGG
jgi:hypothetical protein